MSTHREPRPSDPPDAILKDDCLRCAEQAARPTAMDDAKLRAMMVRTYEVERQDIGRYLTRAEAEAGRFLWHAALAINRVTSIPLASLLAADQYLPRPLRDRAS